MNAMRALLLPVLAMTLVSFTGGCGDGGPGPSASWAPPGRSSNTSFAGGGTDGTAGSDRGGGSTSAIGGGSSGGQQASQPTLRTCSSQAPCGAGEICSRESGTGFCVRTCSLPAGEEIGASPSCASGFQCVRADDDLGVCVLPCETAATCPSLPPLTTRCSSGFCIWSQPVTDTPPPDAGPS